ncbi:protein translocase subunit SecF [Aeromicrobium sp. SMF47]|uniref:Protein-export membrane protein SecF n=1 Tax=Aeromicrobium yanjiei TaxID=2662028 RepID=A0A5Q2MMR8_9ACTN|nr:MULTISPECIES: protein translocase subunit SecF [Aeromicrobium]MRJ77147.1 protein translocase subunit SecF [Aeromicrobium yanjiei]MRK01514.1 protein translocase subunit SecF [Aeromicrobium sp. S22]QGG41715.1 protein translocase subunit SecF [Aeromicrobium yanjiei]
MSRISTFGHNLYEGRVSFDFIGRRKLFYAISAAIVVVAALAFMVRGFNYGVEFKGGVEFTAKVAVADVQSSDAMIQAVEDAGVPDAGDPTVQTSGNDTIRIQTRALTQDEATQVTDSLKKAGATEVSQNLIGPTYGKQVATKALTGLIVFLLIVVVFIWAYFREWRMSVAGIVALIHDLVITAGVYALSGFEVTPATVTGLLTILGFSLYDTVVVFDKVRENTKGILTSTTRTYAEQANLALNQTLVRSINTSITALLPVAALLFAGVFILGTGPLKDLALALFVGMLAGAYSSIFIATPLASQLKEREPAIKAQAARVMARRAKEAREGETPVPAGAPAPARTVRPSAAAKRAQPSRKPRSQRGKGGS